MTGSARGERLNRFLARRGVASRRRADELIAAGRVLVNGQAAGVGALVAPDDDSVSVDGRAVGRPAPATTLMLNKPAGVVTSVSDPQRRLTVMELAPPLPGLVPVGRLDADSRGLLLLTTDGELAHRVSHPRYGVHKRYRVTVSRPVSDAQLQMLLTGLPLEHGRGRALEATRGGTRTVDVTMGEGRKREVRRLCAGAGMTVLDLTRTAVGPLQLGPLREGEHRELTASELGALRAAVGLAASA